VARFERILLDAPCSGLGALRRRPEARWVKKKDSIAGLTTLQESLLLRPLVDKGLAQLIHASLEEPPFLVLHLFVFPHKLLLQGRHLLSMIRLERPLQALQILPQEARRCVFTRLIQSLGLEVEVWDLAHPSDGPLASQRWQPQGMHGVALVPFEPAGPNQPLELRVRTPSGRAVVLTEASWR
jgi:hypothetical protein